jgi:DNA (cytosine-5)-methyltransferase 1
MLKLATVFSGIGAIEHALERLGIPYQCVFACDNGNVGLLPKKFRPFIAEISRDIAHFRGMAQQEAGNGADTVFLEDLAQHLTRIDNLLHHIRHQSSQIGAAITDELLINAIHMLGSKLELAENGKIPHDEYIYILHYMKDNKQTSNPY